MILIKNNIYLNDFYAIFRNGAGFIQLLAQKKSFLLIHMNLTYLRNPGNICKGQVTITVTKKDTSTKSVDVVAFACDLKSFAIPYIVFRRTIKFFACVLLVVTVNKCGK